MNSTTLAPTSFPALDPARLWRTVSDRDRTLALFALLMALAMLPTLVALGLDERTLRGVSVWAKPLKFMASLSLFALSTAWFFSLVAPARRRSAPMRLVVWTIVVAGSLEIAYIVVQAALGQPSHYNTGTRLHTLAYQLMGMGALALMTTQLVLAWQILRHGDPAASAVWRQAVLLGLVMTFVLGVGAAVPLASAQPPSGAGLPVLGWHLGGADLRPAHFIGSHAQQFLPLAGALLAGLPRVRAQFGLGLFASGYAALWLLALLRGLDGAVWLPPPM